MKFTIGRCFISHSRIASNRTLFVVPRDCLHDEEALYSLNLRTLRDPLPRIKSTERTVGRPIPNITDIILKWLPTPCMLDLMLLLAV